jgi:hypothetical protein
VSILGSTPNHTPLKCRRLQFGGVGLTWTTLEAPRKALSSHRAWTCYANLKTLVEIPKGGVHEIQHHYKSSLQFEVLI